MGRRAANPPLLHLLLLTALVVAGASGQNLDLNWPVVHSEAAGSMFGYSVALHREGTVDWLLVGAPKANTSQPGVVEGGAVYKCPVAPLTSPGQCEQIPFDLTGHTTDNLGNQIADKSYQWFGASVKSAGPNGNVVACAPRYTWFLSADMKDDKREPVGHCYVGSDNFASFTEYAPCMTKNVKLWGFNGVTHCQAGFSSEISADNGFLVIGAPGSYYLQGQIYVQNLTTADDPLSTTELMASFDDSYSGFAVALGEFTGDTRPEYVVGAPRGNFLTGKVAIMDATLETLVELVGEQLASYFGHAVVVEDLNGDGLDDIVVGAPMFSDRRTPMEKWEAGKVYIYYQQPDHSFSEASTIIGETLRSRFGSSIASLGDVNQDGFNDIAVGAPYQDQSGVVFIYLGSADGLRLRSSQVLRPSDFNLDRVTTFGYSLSGGLDMDKNNYPDLLIGAQNSATAVLVRARPVISMKALLSVEPEGIDLDNKTFTLPDGSRAASFEITSCFTYTGKHIPDTTPIQYTLSLDSLQTVRPRALFASGSAAGGNHDLITMTLTRDEKWCRVTQAYVKPGIREKLQPISVTIEYGLDKDASASQPHELELYLSPQRSSVTSQQVYIKNNCENNICIPDLQLKATPSVESLIIGSSDPIILNVVVFNSGQDAFQAVLKAIIPPGLQFVRVVRKQMDFSVTCSDDKEVDTLICEIGNPLMAKYQVDFGLKFSPYLLTSEKPSIQFTLSTMSENPEASAMSMVDNYANVTIGFKAKIQIALLGRSIPSQVAFPKEDEEEERSPVTKDTEAGPLVIHVYEVSNVGPSDASLVTFDVSWPMYDEKGDFLLYLTSMEPSAGCQCKVIGQVNPLNLTIEESSENGNVTLDTNREATLLRRQRQADPPAKQSASVDCSSGENCLAVRCTVDQLPSGASEVVKFWSRLWLQNPLFEATTYERVVISSTGVAEVVSIPYQFIEPPELPQVKKEIVTVASPEEPVVKRVPIWVIVLAVIGGLFLLFLVILILWKCGFFKRKKYQVINTDEKRADL